MFEFLENQLWQFLIGAFIAIITIVLSIIIYLKQRDRKRLSYEILSNTSLLSVEEEVKSDVQISYKGNPVEEVRLFILRLSNSGNLPVTSADYEKPISIEFEKETRVLTAEVIGKRPDNLQSTISIEDQLVTLYPTLLNPADFITIKMLVTKYGGVHINSRIIGVSRIDVLHEGSVLTASLILLSLGLLIMAFGSLVWSFIVQASFAEAFSYFNIILYASFGVGTAALCTDKKARKSFMKSFAKFRRESENANYE